MMVDGATVVWDHGTYANKTAHEMATCLGRGHLSFLLNGEKLRGGYALTRYAKVTRRPGCWSSVVTRTWPTRVKSGSIRDE